MRATVETTLILAAVLIQVSPPEPSLAQEPCYPLTASHTGLGGDPAGRPLGDGTSWGLPSTVAESLDGATWVASADFDGDGDLDVLAAADEGGSVGWWDNLNGDGSAWSAHFIDTAFLEAQAAVPADLDGDGDIDVVAASFGLDTINWWENANGLGTAWTTHTITSTADEATAVLASDLDGDGNLDVLGASRSDLSWWENVGGTGTVWEVHLIADGFTSDVAIAAADLDGDGDLDVVRGGDYFSGGDLLWWENLDGVGASWSEHTVTNLLSQVTGVATGDLDGDGDTDLAIVGSVSWEGVRWYENTDGLGSLWTEHVLEQELDGGQSVAADDIDGDGDLDLIAAARSVNDVRWWENVAGDGSAWRDRMVDGTFDGPDSVHVADIDGDGDLDALAAGRFSDQVLWWENVAEKDRRLWVKSVVRGSLDETRAVFAADINGDGVQDALAAFAEGIYWWELWPADPTSNDHPVTLRQPAHGVYAIDLDEDGDTDVLGAGGDFIAWWENRDGGGTVWTETIIDPTFQGADAVSAVDLDGDGDLDVVASAASSDQISWWENLTGDARSWGLHKVTTGLNAVRSARPADIDGDGDLDIVSAADGYFDDGVDWWRNLSGNGTLWNWFQVPGVNAGTRTAEAADIDGDGDLDVISSGVEYPEELVWSENLNGNGGSWVKHLVTDGYGSVTGSPADIDGDGDLDIVAGSRAAEDVSWWENADGGGTTWVEHLIDDSFDQLDAVHTADLDGDGDVDVLGIAFWDDEIAWWENRLETCPPGELRAGDRIALDATPDPGWRVVGWSGTEADASLSTENLVVMPPAAHEVVVHYDVVAPTLAISGTCPGEVVLSGSGLSAGGLFATYAALETGTWPIDLGPCSGTETGLDGPFLLRTAIADDEGAEGVTRSASETQCGYYLQIVDARSCAVSGVEQIPE